MTIPSFVSVVMPNFNGADHISESITSILNQTHQDWELIVCDDGSADDSWEIINSLAEGEQRIKVYKNERNLGNPANRNKLFSLISKESDYVAILDSDDVAEPERLEKQLSFLEEHPDISLVGSAVKIIDELGEERGVRTYPKTHKEIAKKIMVFDPFAQPSVMIRTSALEIVGGYDEQMARCQDYDLFSRFIQAGLLTENLPEPLIKFRVHSNQGKYQNIRKAFIYSFKVRSKYLFSKQFFSLPGLFMWCVYLGGVLSSYVLPSRFYAWVFDTLFIKN